MTIANPNDWERPSGWGANARWGVAALAVLTAHAAAAWFFVQMPPVEQAPAGAPEAPILIDLAPPAPAPSAPAVEAPPAETPTEPEATPEPTPGPEPLPEPIPEPVVTPPPEPLPPEPEPAPVEEPVVEPPPPEPEPVERPPELPETQAPAEAVLNVPVPRARPTPPPRREVAEWEEPRPRTPRREETRREEPKPRAERRAAPPPSRASSSRASREASQGAASRSNVSPAHWQSQVQARLNRFKRTPRGGGTGTVSVSFTIGGSGAAGGIRLSRSSGNPVLDEAALSLIRRASPFPAPPSGSSVSLTVPIAFSR